MRASYPVARITRDAPTRLLVVEDNPGDARLVREFLNGRPVELRFAGSLSAAFAAVEQASFDVVLLDLGLPDSNGVATYRRLAEAAPGTPVIVLTGDGDSRTAIQAVRHGAQDYLVKGEVNGFLLQRCVEYAIERKKQEREREQLLRELAERCKEMNLLYELSRIGADPTLSLEEVCERLVALIPAAWRFPEAACARIRCGDAEYATQGFERTEWRQSADVELNGTRYGTVEICYREPKPELEGNPFLDEEQSLIDTLAKQLGVIAERRRAEEATRVQRNFTDTALDAQQDTFFLFEPETGRAIRWNRAFREISGYTDEEIAELPAPASYYSPEELESAATFVEEVLRVGSGTIELELICRDGRRVPTEYRVAVIDDGSGGPKRLISIGRDVTERRQVAAQLAQSDRLSSMGMLAAGVAHEINNPLSYVMYNLESLAGDMSNKPAGPAAPCDDIRARFDEALLGVHRIRDIVRGLGTFSRVEQDKVAPVSLMQVIDVALSMAQNEVKYRARLVKLFDKTPPVMASEGRLSQVFLNLIINAAHAIEEGDVDNNEIRVRTWVERSEVCAEVRDTGSGIPPEQLDKLFEPFFTTKQIGVGSGLGLAISKSIVEGYGGAISVESEVGVGTAFQIRLPIGNGSGEQIAERFRSRSAPSIKGRILVVDDERIIRRAMSRMLRDHDIELCASGAEAMGILVQDQDFDLILCDMMMSDVSGMELHQWLTEVEPRLARQLIFMTGGAFTPSAGAYLDRVDNIRLEKPFEVTNLRKIVAELVRANRSDR